MADFDLVKKRNRASSSTAPSDGFDRKKFLSLVCASAHLGFSRCSMNEAKPLPPSPPLNSQIEKLFVDCGLDEVLRISENFSSHLIHLFYANLTFEADLSILKSFIRGRFVEFTREEVANYLQVPFGGVPIFPTCDDPEFDWSEVNNTLRGTADPSHIQPVKNLLPFPYIIQHVLRYNLIQKGGDKMNITPPISLATYYVLTHTPFDVPHTIFSMMHYLSSMSDPTRKRVANLSFGHIIAFLLRQKYNYISSSKPDHILKPFAAAKLNNLGIRRSARPPRQGSDSEEEDDGGNADVRDGIANLRESVDNLREDFNTRMTVLDSKMDLIISRLPAGSSSHCED